VRMRPKEWLAALCERLLGRRNFVRLSRFLLDRARLDVPNAIEANGELLIQRAALAACPPCRPRVVLDVGANAGQWTAQLLRQARELGIDDLVVHAFEPSQHTWSLLTENSDLRGYAVETIRAAVSDTAGTAMLHKAHEGAGANSLHRLLGSADTTDEEVGCITLDAYCEDREIQCVSLLKCDAEGHDLYVLTGARRMLEGHRIRALQFEYNHQWISARSFLIDAFAFLMPRGYSLGKVTPRGVEWYRSWHPELETFREGNYVAIPSDASLPLASVRWWNDRD
jgi:FkbM family methyltransferase